MRECATEIRGDGYLILQFKELTLFGLNMFFQIMYLFKMLYSLSFRVIELSSASKQGLLHLEPNFMEIIKPYRSDSQDISTVKQNKPIVILMKRNEMKAMNNIRRARQGVVSDCT